MPYILRSSLEEVTGISFTIGIEAKVTYEGHDSWAWCLIWARENVWGIYLKKNPYQVVPVRFLDVKIFKRAAGAWQILTDWLCIIWCMYSTDILCMYLFTKKKKKKRWCFAR